MLQILFHLFLRWLRKKTSFIYLGVMLIIFFPTFKSIHFDPLLSFFLFIFVIILAVVASFVVSGLTSASMVMMSRARVKELARQYPELAELEKKHSSLAVIRMLYFVGCAVVVILGTMISVIGSLAIIITVAPITYLLIIRKKEDELQKSFKQIIVLDELSRSFSDVRLEPRGCFPAEEISELQLFNDFHAIRGNDLISAKRGDRYFRRCDLHLQRIYTFIDENESKKETAESIFKGSVFHFELSEPSPVRLIAATEGFAHLQEVGSDFKKLFGGSNKHSVETEMDEFNRRFDVYCSDQTAARIILTPQMIEGINRIGRLVDNELAMVFKDSSLYLFLSTPGVDSFEVSASDRKTLSKQHEMVAAQVAFIAAIIDNMYFKGEKQHNDAYEHSAQLTAKQRKLAVGRSASATRGRLSALKRLTIGSASTMVFLIFVISCICAAFLCPDGIALGISIADGIVSVDNFVPLIPYIITFCIFMAVFCFGARHHPYGLPAAMFLLLIHAFLLWASITA